MMLPQEIERKVKVRVAGIPRGIPINELLEEPLLPRDTAARLLARLDKKKALGRNFFKKLMKNGGIVFLINGERIESSEVNERFLHENDEISILTTVAGG